MDNQCVNPFHHRFRFRTVDYIHIFLGTIFLMPIRIVLFVFLFIASSMLAKLFNYLLESWKLDKEEETKWRILLKKPVSYTLRAAFFVSGFYKVRFDDKGGPDAEQKARILVIAPHTSPFDVLVGVALDCPSVVAKHDVLDIPFFGNIIKMTDPVLVERSSQSSRNNVISDVLEKIKHHRMVFFPEGTCSNRRALCQFKVGAFKPGMPVQPIIVRYDQGGGPDTLSWTWDGPPALLSIYLTLCRFSTGLEIVKLPVYYPTEEERTDAELFANNLSKLMSNHLKIQSLYYSFDDSRYIPHRVFRSPVCLKLFKLCDKIVNENQSRNGLVINNNYHSSGTANGVNTKIPKKEILKETVIKFISDVTENIELQSPKDINSIDDLNSVLNLDKYPELCKSATVKELHHCLKLCAQTPNSTHLAVVLQLCDIRVQSFWQRLDNSFNTLATNRLNGESNTISGESLRSLLWLAFGVQPAECGQSAAGDVLFDNSTKITFEQLEKLIRTVYKNAATENGRELFQDSR